MTLPFSQLLQQHPTNPVQNVATLSTTNKEWANNYHVFRNMSVYTAIDGHGRFTATFEPPFLPKYDDNIARGQQPSYPPNMRQWRLQSEQDMKDWFLTEILNVVLAGWSNLPVVLQQSEILPLNARSAETVDHFLTIFINGLQLPLLAGEFKKSGINRDQWQQGHLTTSDQKKLSRELRGYYILH